MNYLKTFDIAYLLELYGENVIASMTDSKGTIRFVSTAYERISGYSKAELLGKKHNIVRHPDMPSSLFKDLWQTIKSGKVWRGEVKNLKKNGGFYWVKATVTPQFDEDKNLIGYASIREDITDKKEAISLHTQIQNMINTIEDGFLIFDKSMKIKDGYSKKCLEILGQKDITYKNISQIMFANNEELQETFNFGTNELFKTNDRYTKELYLSLLPTKHCIKDKIFTIDYKLLENDELLVLIRDITKEKKLEKKIQDEQKMQKMLLSLITHKHETIELIKSYRLFLKNFNTKNDNKKLKIDLHTFKGLFTQLEIIHTKNAIHLVEEKLKINPLELYLETILTEAFEKDLKIILNILGEDFLSLDKFVKVDFEQFDILQNKVENLIFNSTEHKEELTQLRDEISRLKDTSLYDMLSIYSITIQNLSKDTEKKVNPLKIIGDKKILLDETYKGFINSLIHIFRNSIVHGIEMPETRIENHKKENGTILTNFKLVDNNIVLEISDDGKGIDINSIKRKALELELTTEEKLNTFSTQEILQFIFSDEFSTIKKVDEIAGRGVGLASVKYEVLKLNGTIEIVNKPNIGLSFIFTIPYHKIYTKEIDVLATAIAKTIKKFLTDDISIKSNQIQSIPTIDFNSSNYISMINLTGTSNLFFMISLEESVLNKIYDVFTGGDMSDNELEMKKTLIDEIINIVIGLSIQHFPSKYNELTLSTPFILEADIIETFIKNNQSSSFQIQTNYGDFEFLIIEI